MKKLYLLVFIGSLFLTESNAQTVSLTTLNNPYEQDFNTLAFSGSSSTLPTGWLMSESGSGAANNGLYLAGTGSGNTGDTYSFGSANTTERALGGLRSGTLIPLIGASFANNSGGAITTLRIQYQGEQWRLGTANRGSDRLDFQISYDATSLTTGTWSNVDALDFVGPVNTGTLGALIGNNNAVTISLDITGVNILPGQSFFIRWTDADVSGADDGLSIDNFSLTPIGNDNEPSISFSPASVAFGDVNAGQQQTLSYEVVASNLEADIEITSEQSEYLISTDNLNFSSSATLSQDGGVVYVQFTPTANGSVETELEHVSSTYSNSIHVSGFGFEQAANIIPIATARAKSVGTKVTVAGRITVADELGNPAYVQDGTGGIPVFDFALATGVQLGDSVIVTGPIGVFNDQKQISGSGIFFTLVSGASRIPSPKIITLNQLAANEGLLVTIPGVEVVNKNFVFYPQSTEQIADGTTTADLRIDGDTDIPGLAKPQGTFDITGVVGRFRTNMQLLPRFQADVPGAIEPSLPTDSIPKSETLDIVNWNLEFFGARSEDYGGEEFGPADEALQFENVKSVINSLDADIIAVEEVSDETLLATLVSQLSNHSYICSPRFSRSFEGPSNDFPPQKVCLIYDNTTVTVLSARAMFESRYDSARLIDESLLPGYPSGDPSSFYSSGRLPFLVNVKTKIQGVAENISLVILHAKSGSTVADYNRRVYDAAVLKDSLDQHYGNANVVILGDLNDDLDESIVTGRVSSYQAFVDDVNYLPITKSLSEAGARSTVSFQDVIDHQILTTELADEFLGGSQMIITPFRSIRNYASTTSDHLPVISRYHLSAPVVQFDSDFVSVTEDTVDISVSVHFSKPLTENKTLQIELSGTASYSSDFSSQPNGETGTVEVNLIEGDTSAVITLSVIDDLADEFTESVTLTIVPQQGLELAASAFTLEIEDNDVPSIQFESDYAEAHEGDVLEIVLKLSTPVITDQVITLNVSNGKKTVYDVDYTTNPAVVSDEIVLEIPAGSSEVKVELNALNDKKREKDELVHFSIADVTDGLQATSILNSTAAILNTKFRPQILISPNPTTDIVNVICDELDANEILSAELATSNGDPVLMTSGNLNELSTKLSYAIQASKKGIYILTLRLEDETYSIRIAKK